MSLLPSHHEEFRSREYWDRFFKNRGETAFEWYGDYAAMKPVFKQLASPDHDILVIGCGNSESSGEMYDDGFKHITNIDFSELVIDEMIAKNIHRPEMLWRVMDMTRLDLPDASCDVVVDKGALDALMSNDTEEIQADAKRMFDELSRVLRNGGHYICVTMAQEFILRAVLRAFGDGWRVTITHIRLIRDESPLSPFIVVVTKDESRTPSGLDVELRFAGADGVAPSTGERLGGGADTEDRVVECVRDSQMMSVKENELKQVKVGRVELLELHGGEQRSAIGARFVLRVVDHSVQGAAGVVAVFITPRGREHEWMFSSDEGLKQLASSAGFSRLVCVALSRGHSYGSMQEVQDELSPLVLPLAPTMHGTEGVDTSSLNIPFLSVGGGLGRRAEVHRGTSELSGEFVVEDVAEEEVAAGAEGAEGDLSGETRLRRLVFLNNQNVIQSEVRVLPKKKNSKKKKGKKKIPVDPWYLAFEYHRAMAAAAFLSPALAATSSKGVPPRALLVGLGGGAFPMYLHSLFSAPGGGEGGVSIRVVELDAAVASVASGFFGFAEGPRMELELGDGLLAVRQLAAESAAAAETELTVTAGEGGAAGTTAWDLVVLDVDSKDVSVGMSCPPAAFVELEYLKCIVSLLAPGGVLLINLACRDAVLREGALQAVDEAIGGRGEVYTLIPDAEDVNTVVAAVKAGGAGGSAANGGQNRRAALAALEARVGKAASDGVVASSPDRASAEVFEGLLGMAYRLELREQNDEQQEKNGTGGGGRSGSNKKSKGKKGKGKGKK